MSEVKVEKQDSLPKREGEAGARSPGEFFRPTLPLGRFFGMSPLAAMRELSDQINRAFGMSAPSLDTWAPAVDVQRCNGDLVVTAELPGVKKEDVKIEVTEDALVIEGERKLEHRENHEGYHRYERSYGKFYRSIPLPQGAKAEEATAELNEGVLKISVPVPEVKTIRQVPIGAPAEKKIAA